jgi:hypothetical protein
MERPARDKYSSLLQKFVIYDCKKFHNIYPCTQKVILTPRIIVYDSKCVRLLKSDV